jgi:predicted ArsR family transcriptional regulator
MLSQQWKKSSRGRIVSLLRRGARTADELAKRLGLTRSAVRIQLAAMEKDGAVRKSGKRAGTTRPSVLYELTPEAEQVLSTAYVPLLVQLIGDITAALPAGRVEALLRNTGRNLGVQLTAGKPPTGSLRSRAAKASELLNTRFGASTSVEANGHLAIRSAGCPLAALTGTHPGVCLAMESLVAEVVGAPVRECCERAGRPRCGFEIVTSSSGTATTSAEPSHPSSGPR